MLRAGVNQASVAKVPFTTMTERRSRAMAAVNFIKGFQSELEDEMKILNIKVDGVLSSTLEGYYLYKQFQSMVVESGFNVDETFDKSKQC
ncbi:Glycogen synthase [Trichinella pseudospiralis]